MRGSRKHHQHKYIFYDHRPSLFQNFLSRPHFTPLHRRAKARAAGVVSVTLDQTPLADRGGRLDPARRGRRLREDPLSRWSL